jgi:hypothetical protein
MKNFFSERMITVSLLKLRASLQSLISFQDATQRKKPSSCAVKTSRQRQSQDITQYQRHGGFGSSNKSAEKNQIWRLTLFRTEQDSSLLRTAEGGCSGKTGRSVCEKGPTIGEIEKGSRFLSNG